MNIRSICHYRTTSIAYLCFHSFKFTILITNHVHVQHALVSLVLREDAVAAEACSDEAKDDNGMTALLRAASGNNWKEVRRLMLCGADPSVADSQGSADGLALRFFQRKHDQPDWFCAKHLAERPACLLRARKGAWRLQRLCSRRVDIHSSSRQQREGPLASLLHVNEDSRRAGRRFPSR